MRFLLSVIVPTVLIFLKENVDKYVTHNSKNAIDAVT